MNIKLRSIQLLIVFFVLLWQCQEVLAQDQVTVTGTVTVQETGATLPGVNITVEGTTTGTSTDANGMYEISVSPEATLVFSSIGFATREISVEGRSTIDVVMVEDVEELDEMVVIGYGEQARRTLTTSVSKLDTSTLNNVPFTNIGSALQGNVSGLRVQNTTGQPGTAPRIILRGGTSISNPEGAQPLYIVDGVKRNNLNDISSNNIESIQVLKDAASTAIYGARASNGVVIVETKSGQAGSTQINYRSSVQFSQLGDKYDLGSAREYIKYGRMGMAATGEKHPQYLGRLDWANGFGTGNDLTKNTAFTPQYLTPENEHKLNEGWESMPDPLDPSKTIIFNSTNWQDKLFRTAVTTNHYLSASGGSETATYRVGLGWLNSEGAAIETGYERLNFDASGNVQVRDNISVSADVNFSNSSDSQVFSINQIFQRALALPQTAKFRYEDGTLAPGQNRSMGNPVYHLNRSLAENNLNRLTLGLSGIWDITDNISFEPSASLYTVQGIDNSFQKSYYNTATQFINSRNASASHSLYWQREVDGVFTYANSFSQDHNFSAKAGFSYYDRKNYNLYAAGRGAATDNIPTLNAASEETAVSSSTSHQVIAGYFSRVSYDFDQKYLLSASARYDGASNLGDNSKWGLFPGVSAGWNMHEEGFWSAVPEEISSFKLRASYGINGNISGLSDFHAQGQYSVGSEYNGQPIVASSRLPNQDLKWERSRTVDVGIDVGLFDDRLTFLADYYRRVTDDLLQSLELPHYTGFLSILTNLGSLENKGVEFEVEADILRNQSGLNWSLGANASYNQNTILELPENDNENNRIGGILVYDRASGEYVYKGGLQEGGRLGDMFAYQQEGIYATDEEAANGPVDELVTGTDKTKFGGDVKWLDKDDNGVIDNRDRVYAGNRFPNWTGGISSTFNYKNLDIFVRTDFALGHTIYHESLARFNGQFQGDINISQEVVEESWKEQGDQTDVPRYYWADQLAQNNLFRGNTRYYEKGDYLAIREITLSYTFPARWLNKAGFKNIRAYATGNNLHYITNYKGLLPEEGGQDSGRYPNPQSFILGVEIGL
ncbi:SusC/RagA family TonB-linked outer membrane protein [Fodinibius sediminis]|uniref:TonB-linked outer membrane protein, SusC/RagA family n=1 Tax=Fodinibius sediminis TaxID=1214077 RepID=A0A521EQ81_9BACT|nr:TonB-dependent receptor [Fodinibius sediminis]SMO86084.1 TonB-linked outer membrane protein, SusC/RagA family [Fodinibius sediminis]